MGHGETMVPVYRSARGLVIYKEYRVLTFTLEERILLTTGRDTQLLPVSLLSCRCIDKGTKREDTFNHWQSYWLLVYMVSLANWLG